MSEDTFFNIPIDFGISGKDIKKDEAIAFKKIYSKLCNYNNEDGSLVCPICNQSTTSFCNSHSIPRFCLRQITDNGMLISPGFIFDSPIFEYQTGVAKSGTFHLICEKCDHEMFSEYEQPQNYSNFPSKKMLAEIAMKSSLKSMHKRIMEIKIYQKIIEINNDPYYKDALKTSKRDYEDFKKDFLYSKKAIENCINSQYQLGYYKKLNYTIPVAAQIAPILITDLNGYIVNNVFDKSSSYNLQPLYLCLFPLETCSVIILFFKNGHNKLRNLCKAIKSLPENDQLQLISYISFLYCEDIYMNEKIQHVLKEYDNVKKVIRTSSITVGLSDNPQKITTFKKINSIKDEFNLNQYKTFPNVLSEEFKIIKTVK